MNLLFHQLRSDLRAHRGSVALALVLALLGPSAGMLLDDQLGGGLADLARVGLALAIVLAGTLAIFGGLRETPLVGDRRFWCTRPLPGTTVFLVRGLWLLAFLGALALGTWFARRSLHLTPTQLATTTFLSVGWMSTLLLVANNLRSVSDAKRAFFARLTLAIGGFFLSFLLASVVLRATGRLGGTGSFVANLVLTFAVSIVLLLVAWVGVARFRKPKASMVLSFGAILLMPWLLSGLFLPVRKPAPAPIATPTVTVVEPDEVRAGEVPAGQLLWENLVIGDLQPGQVFAPTELLATLAPSESESKTPSTQSLSMPPSSIHTARQHVGDAPLWQAIQAQLPDGVLWDLPIEHGISHALSFGNAASGEVGFELEGRILGMRPLATTAGRNSSAAMSGGGRLTIRERSVDTNRLALGLELLFPEAELLESPPFPEEHVSPFRDNLWCVLFDTRSKQALGIDPNAARSYRDTYALGLRKERLEFAAPLPADWLKRFRETGETLPQGFELHVFTLQPVAVVRKQTLTRADYHPEPSLPERRLALEFGDFAKATLPPSPDKEQVERFLDIVIGAGPDDRGDSPYLEKFRQLPDEALPLLAARLPVHEDADRAARTTLVQRPDALEPGFCLEALRRDPLFVDLCVKKGLEAEAAEIVRPLLRRRQPLQPDVAPTILRLAIERFPLDDALAADLRWHFVRAGWKQYQATSFLADLPGFDFDAAVAEAWKRVPPGQDEYSQRELAPYVLRLGDKEALRLTLLKLRGRIAEWDRERTTALLVDRLATGQEPEAAAAWAEQHFTELRFDPETRRFALP